MNIQLVNVKNENPLISFAPFLHSYWWAVGSMGLLLRPKSSTLSWRPKHHRTQNPVSHCCRVNALKKKKSEGVGCRLQSTPSPSTSGCPPTSARSERAPRPASRLQSTESPPREIVPKSAPRVSKFTVRFRSNWPSRAEIEGGMRCFSLRKASIAARRTNAGPKWCSREG
jgi:hypothetical protein